MVLDLSVICLRSICDGVETGQISARHLASHISPHYLTSSSSLSTINLRQRLLDLAWIRGSMDNPNCITAFSSTEFLDGMTSLNTAINVDKDDYHLAQYVLKLAVSLGADSRINPKVTIGSRFRQLSLWADGNELDSIGNIISNCPYLRSLELVIVQYEGGTKMDIRHSVNLLAQNQVICRLDELSIDYSRSPQCATIIRPSVIERFLVNVEFVHLRSLRISGYEGDCGLWTMFLQSMRSTLMSLTVGNICLSSGNDELIPFPMERLQRVRIDAPYIQDFRLSPVILAQCRELAFLRVPLMGSTGTERASIRMRRLAVDLSVDVSLDSSDPHFVQNQPRFPIVDTFGENIFMFTYVVDQMWSEYEVSALVNAFASCYNMHHFRLHGALCSPVIDLDRLFTNAVHPRLRQIELEGNVKVGKLFESFTNLTLLALRNTTYIRDEDLIGWTRIGGGRRLSRLEIRSCLHLTYQGVVALLIACGSTLEKFEFRGDSRLDWEVPQLKRDLLQYCPFATFE